MVFEVGDRVDYHAVIGGSVTSYGHRITKIGNIPSKDGVAWLTDKIGCVSLDALSPAMPAERMPIDVVLQKCANANRARKDGMCIECLDNHTNAERQKRPCYARSACPECQRPVDECDGCGHSLHGSFVCAYVGGGNLHVHDGSCLMEYLVNRDMASRMDNPNQG